MRLLVAGATGLIGREFVRLALESGHEISAVGRRPVDGVQSNIATDFQSTPALPGADAAVCALGTTIATAGSRRAFNAIDHDAVLNFARAALDAGVERFIVVSAVGASARSPVFYSRVKGETERDLRELGFARLDVMQPGLLLGDRQEQRRGEAFFQRLDPLLRPFFFGSLRRYAGIPAVTVAGAMLALCARRDAGCYVHTNTDMASLYPTPSHSAA
jgi:uncharacterized protein YbjT (DUF2867 family)